MKSENWIGFIAAGLLSALTAGGVLAQEKIKPGALPEKSAGSLLRKDLLAVAPGAAVSPLRDIFRPGSSRAGLGSAAERPVSPAVSPEESGKGSKGASSSSPFVLDYIGYVRSPHRIIALIILDGQALAVVEGEEILPGVKVDKVGPDEIEISGPGAGKSRFPRQGEDS